jgi:hypothetical protein
LQATAFVIAIISISIMWWMLQRERKRELHAVARRCGHKKRESNMLCIDASTRRRREREPHAVAMQCRHKRGES